MTLDTMDKKLNDYLYNSLTKLKLSLKKWYDSGDLNITSSDQRWTLSHNQLKSISKELGFDPILDHSEGKLELIKTNNPLLSNSLLYTTDVKVEKVSNNDITITLSFNYSTLVSNSKHTSDIYIPRIVEIIVPTDANYVILDKSTVLYQKIKSEYRYDLNHTERQIDILLKDTHISSLLDKNFTLGTNIMYILMGSFYELQDNSTRVVFNIYSYEEKHEFLIMWKVLLLNNILSKSSTSINEGEVIVPTWTFSMHNIS